MREKSFSRAFDSSVVDPPDLRVMAVRESSSMDGLYARLVMTEDRPIPHWFLLYGWPHRQTNNASFVTHTIPTQKAYHRDVPTVGQHWSTFDNQSNNNASLIGLVYEISRYKINGQNIWCVEL